MQGYYSPFRPAFCENIGTLKELILSLSQLYQNTIFSSLFSIHLSCFNHAFISDNEIIQYYHEMVYWSIGGT